MGPLHIKDEKARREQKSIHWYSLSVDHGEEGAQSPVSGLIENIKETAKIATKGMNKGV